MRSTTTAYDRSVSTLRRSLSVILLAATVAGLAAACSQDPVARRQRFFESGEEYAKQGRFREAAIEYRNAVQSDPSFAPARVKLAEAYSKVGNGGGALQEYVRAADLLPDDVDLQITAGRYLLAARRFDDALVRADAALKRQPNHADAHVLRGSALGGLNNLEQAITEIEEAIRLDPSRGASHLQLGFVELARGRRAEAEAALLKGVSLEPKAIGGHLAIANFYVAIGEAQKAQDALTAALAIDPKHEAANRAMAVFSLITRRPAEAEKYLKQVVEVSKSPEAVYSLADYYVGVGRPQQAVESLRPLGESPQATPEARTRLAGAHAAAGDRARAHELIEGLLKDSPKNASAKLLQGQLFFDEGRSDEALASVQEAVAIEPGSTMAQFALGKIYASRGDTRGAEQAFREVLRINPKAVPAQLELSRVQLSANNAADSLSLAEEAATAQPGNLQARLALVRSLVGTRDFARAEREMKTLIAERPNVPQVLILNGIVATARNDMARARADFNRALELDPDSTEALAAVVGLDLGTKDVRRAVERIETRLGRGKPGGDVFLLAARVYAAANDLDKAEQVLRRAIDTQPALLPAYGMLGQLYVQRGRLDDALAEFDTLAKRQSSPVGALTMSGIILQTQGKQTLARQRFEQALAIDPHAAVAANNLAWLYLEAKENINQAVQLAEAAANALPDRHEVLHTLGWANYHNNVPTLAITHISRAIEKEPKRALYYYHLGLAYVKAGEIESARRALQRAIALDPKSPEARDAQRALEQLPTAKAS